MFASIDHHDVPWRAGFSLAEIGHARRVLTRLIHLTIDKEN